MIRLILVLIVAVLHFAVSSAMFARISHIPPPQSGFQPRAFTEQEIRDVKVSTIVNMPFVTMHDRGIFFFPRGGGFLPFVVDSLIWAMVIVLIPFWLYRKLRHA